MTAYKRLRCPLLSWGRAQIKTATQQHSKSTMMCDKVSYDKSECCGNLGPLPEQSHHVIQDAKVVPKTAVQGKGCGSQQVITRLWRGQWLDDADSGNHGDFHNCYIVIPSYYIVTIINMYVSIYIIIYIYIYMHIRRILMYIYIYAHCLYCLLYIN